MRALVVDDSRPVRGIIAKIMQSLNFETDEVNNGKEAMETLLRGDVYDVVTVNWQMPVMDGIEFVSAVRKHRRFQRLPLLMISSESDSQRVAMALRSGVNQYIVKPCTPRAVASKLTAMGLITEEDLEDFDSSDDFDSGIRSPLTVRVLVVDDSLIVRRVVSKMLNKADDIEVAGTAHDGVEALEMIQSVKPDVVLLDVDMPRMDGIEALRQMRDQNITVPVLMFSSRTERGAEITTDALMLGAKDFVFKPGGADMSDLEAGRRAIEEEIIPRLRSLTRPGRRPKPEKPKPTRPREERKTPKRRSTDRVDLVVIGASTGGPAALADLVSDSKFQSHLLAPVLIAQHMPRLFTKTLADRLAADSGLDIAESVEGEVLKPGMIRIAAGGRHLFVERGAHGELVSRVCDDPPVNSCRPSADVLFDSAAKASRGNVLAVVLTGMGHDGTDGCRAIRDSGGRVLIQDQETSVVWGMPGSVAKEGLADAELPLEKIACTIARELRAGR